MSHIPLFSGLGIPCKVIRVNTTEKYSHSGKMSKLLESKNHLESYEFVVFHLFGISASNVGGRYQ